MICHNQIKVLYPRSGSHRKVKQNDNLCPVQDSGSLAVFKVTARDQGHYKGPSGAFVTYCNISCFFFCFFFNIYFFNIQGIIEVPYRIFRLHFDTITVLTLLSD